jgi:hypothetical protein
VDTDAKKAELFHKGLTIQLQERLILSQNLSYNELASAAIDQEGTMKAYEAAEEKKRKRVVSGPSGGSSSCAPLKYRMIYTPLALRHCSGAITTAAAVAIQLRSTSTAVATAAGGSQATTVVYTYRLPVLQLRENRPLHHGLSSVQAGQCTSCSSYWGEPAEGPVEGPSTIDWPCQLHHRGWNSHERKSACWYVLFK